MEVELNFIDKLPLSKAGIIDAIRMELDVIRLCLSSLYENDKSISPTLNRIIVMPLRKLVCEDTIINIVCPDFRMPPIKGKTIELCSSLKYIIPPYRVCSKAGWLSLKEWQKQKIAWFERTESDHKCTIPKETYLRIIGILNGSRFQNTDYKKTIESLFTEDSLNKVYNMINSKSEHDRNSYFKIIKEIGYDDLTVLEYIKQTADQTGAHLDRQNTIMAMLLNTPDSLGMTPSYYFAIQLIIAAKEQIPELSEYWKEMPKLVEEG